MDPDRSWHGRTYVPATTTTTGGYELYGYVRYVPAGEEGGEPSDFTAQVDFTDQTASANPQWSLDLCDEVIGSWRGPGGDVAAMTLVWGRPLVAGGAIVTAELADLAVDQCELAENRFTLIAPTTSATTCWRSSCGATKASSSRASRCTRGMRGRIWRGGSRGMTAPGWWAPLALG